MESVTKTTNFDDALLHLLGARSGCFLDDPCNRSARNRLLKGFLKLDAHFNLSSVKSEANKHVFAHNLENLMQLAL